MRLKGCIGATLLEAPRHDRARAGVDGNGEGQLFFCALGGGEDAWLRLARLPGLLRNQTIANAAHGFYI